MPEPNYDTNIFLKYLLAREMKKAHIFMNKTVYLGLAKLETSKIIMYEFWCDHAKLKYGEKLKSCYVDTVSFIISIITKYIYKDITQDVEIRHDTSNYELNRPLPRRTNKKVIGFMKVELDGKIIVKFVALRPKT